MRHLKMMKSKMSTVAKWRNRVMTKKRASQARISTKNGKILKIKRALSLEMNSFLRQRLLHLLLWKIKSPMFL